MTIAVIVFPVFFFWQIPKSLMTAWKVSVAEAEFLLPERQKNRESALSVPIAEELIPSPLPSEKPEVGPSVSAVDPCGPPSRHIAPNRNERQLLKNSTCQTNKNKSCKRKKKCLSDIFGHIVSGSKESTTVTKQFHTTVHALKDEPKDSPYADLDSVPMLHRPKRTAVSPIQDIDGLIRKEPGATKAKKNTEEVNQCADSSGILKNKLTSKDTNPEQKSGSCLERMYSSGKKHSADLPASSRLMTRALKAEEETDLKDALAKSQISTDRDVSPDNAPITGERSPDRESPRNTSSFGNHTSPKKHIRKFDKKLIHNGSLIRSKCADSAEATVQPVRIKMEVPDLSTTPPSLSVSPMGTFQDVKELMFKSLAAEDSSDSDISVFRPDSNYKFSTFLMLLKDMHDIREKEGKPLTVPLSPVLIKEEPLVIPTSTEGDPLKGSCDGVTRGIKLENGQSGKSTSTQNAAVKTKNKTKGIMRADTYYCEDFPVHTQPGSADKQRRKQRLPAKLKLNIPGLSSDLAAMAYGREFVSGHADLANAGSDSHVAADPSTSYLNKNSESTVAPKKRWLMVEEDQSAVLGEVKQSYTLSTSPGLDLEAEGHAENDSHFSDASNSAGKTQANPTEFVCKMMEKLICGLFIFAQDMQRTNVFGNQPKDS